MYEFITTFMYHLIHETVYISALKRGSVCRESIWLACTNTSDQLAKEAQTSVGLGILQSCRRSQKMAKIEFLWEFSPTSNPLAR